MIDPGSLNVRQRAIEEDETKGNFCVAQHPMYLYAFALPQSPRSTLHAVNPTLDQTNHYRNVILCYNLPDKSQWSHWTLSAPQAAA
jgi:hypothetical protein